MAELATNMLNAVKRQRGLDNITVAELARQTGVGKITLYEILNGHRTNARPSTIAKLNAWLYTKI